MTQRPAGWKPYSEVHKGSDTVSGTVLAYPKVEGDPGIPAREICAYLPPSLAASIAAGETSHRRYPVLYFMDGQNVFDEKTSYIGVKWAADEALEKLAADGIEAIAVAVYNDGDERMPGPDTSVEPLDLTEWPGGYIRSIDVHPAPGHASGNGRAWIR